MSYSLNEIEATAKKAARGAGYSWGMAEEAGKAVRWLCSKNFDGCEALSSLLETSKRVDLATRRAQMIEDIWQCESNEMCPLLAGAALSDFAHKLRQGAITMMAVTSPLLLVPFAAAAARQLQSTITISWDGVSATTDGSDISVVGDFGSLASEMARCVEVGFGAELDQTLPSISRAVPDVTAWTLLCQFAHRTYAPATEESRLSGAGAGITDND